MKIYITRKSARAILYGGLERLDVWFAKPVYCEFKIYDPTLSPFNNSEKEGCFEGGLWKVTDSGKLERASVSFGKVFGYSNSPDEGINKLAEFVWAKLVEHFGNTKMSEEWITRENQKLSNIQDFFLEIELQVEMKT